MVRLNGEGAVENGRLLKTLIHDVPPDLRSPSLVEVEVVPYLRFVIGCEEGKLDDPSAPVWSRVYRSNAEAFDCGTIATTAGEGDFSPHFHVSVGLKEPSAVANTSHLLRARVQFLVEMILAEVLAPKWRRTPNPDLYGVPSLGFQ